MSMSNKAKIREDAMSLNPMDDALFQKSARSFLYAGCQMPAWRWKNYEYWGTVYSKLTTQYNEKPPL